MNIAKQFLGALRRSRVNDWRSVSSCRPMISIQSHQHKAKGVHFSEFNNVQCIPGLTKVTYHFHTSIRHRAFNEVETGEEFCITYSNLKNGVENDSIQVIDVRRPDEVEEGHIPAKRFIHIPVQDVAEALQMSEADFKKQYGADKPLKEATDIVFHCKLGGRSTYALRIAQNLGYSKARHYPGGWTEWSEKSS